MGEGGDLWGLLSQSKRLRLVLEVNYRVVDLVLSFEVDRRRISPCEEMRKDLLMLGNLLLLLLQQL